MALLSTHADHFQTFKLFDAREVQRLPWNDLLIDMHTLSNGRIHIHARIVHRTRRADMELTAYSRLLLITHFFNALSDSSTFSSTAQPKLNTTTRTVLRDLFSLFALTSITADSMGFLTSGTLDRSQVEAIPGQVRMLMQRIRPHAVRLVDAWAVPDYLLDRYEHLSTHLPVRSDGGLADTSSSALGRSDGQAYEDMFHRVHNLNPLNRITFNPDYRSSEIVMGSGDAGKDILAKL